MTKVSEKVKVVEIAECATDLNPPKGKMALLRDVQYRSTLQTVLTATGNKSLDNGDTIAQMLRGADLETVYKIGAKELGVKIEELKLKYGHLNPGQQRMNVGNRIRGAIRKREAQAKEQYRGSGNWPPIITGDDNEQSSMVFGSDRHQRLALVCDP